MKCIKCGAEIADGGKFCPACGTPVSAAEPSKAPALEHPGEPTKKKGRGCLVALLVVIGIIIAGVIAAGFILPGLLWPRDLGSKTSKQAYESSLTKLGITKDEAPSAGKAEDYVYIYGEPKKVNAKLTSDELTSFFNYNRPDYYALKNVQIRVNGDDTVEISASLDRDYFLNNVLSADSGVSDITADIPGIGILPGSINVYAKMSGGVADNKASGLSLSSLEVMGIDITGAGYSAAEISEGMTSVLNGFLASTSEKTGADYDLIKPQDGAIEISGMLPSSLKREAK